MSELKFQFNEPHGIINSNLDLKEKKIKLQILQTLLLEDLKQMNIEDTTKQIEVYEKKRKDTKKMKSSLDDEINIFNKQLEEIKNQGDLILKDLQSPNPNVLNLKNTKILIFSTIIFVILAFSYPYIFILFVLFVIGYVIYTDKYERKKGMNKQNLNDELESLKTKYKITTNLLNHKLKEKTSIDNELNTLNNELEHLVNRKIHFGTLNDHLKYTKMYLGELKDIKII